MRNSIGINRNLLNVTKSYNLIIMQCKEYLIDLYYEFVYNASSGKRMKMLFVNL